MSGYKDTTPWIKTHEHCGLRTHNKRRQTNSNCQWHVTWIHVFLHFVMGVQQESSWKYLESPPPAIAKQGGRVRKSRRSRSSTAASPLHPTRFATRKSVRHINTIWYIHNLTRLLLTQRQVLPRRCLARMQCLSLTWEESTAFSFIPTRFFLHQPYMVYTIFTANRVMKPHFVQTEAVKRESERFGNGWRWRVSCKILLASQVRKMQFKVDPGHGHVRGGGNSWKARAQRAYGMWPGL